MEDPTLATLFGPLNRKYCLWFYWLSVIFFVYMVIAVLGLVYAVATNKIRIMSYKFTGGMIALSMWFFWYFQNRLLYTMCSGSA